MSKILNQTNKPTLDQLITTLKKGKTFCLSGHQNPDADVIGSELALKHFIEKLGPDKKVSIINSGKPPKSLSYLPGFEFVQHADKVSGHFDVVVAMECSGAERMGNIIDLKTQATDVLNIDHHLHNPNFGTINFVEPTTSSTAELIFKIYTHNNTPLTKEVALCIYTGLVADTGWFRFGNTNEQTHMIASRLLAVGVPISDLSEKMYMSRSKASMKLLASLLQQMTYHFDDQVVVMKIPLSLMDEIQAESDDLEEVVNFGLMRDTVNASVLLKEKEASKVIKVSLRSKGNWDINQIARTFDGGGHRNASGATIFGNLDKAEELILGEMGKIFKSST
ncbi:hypothetical protein BVX98_00615 [bacterium F11]|nr:hypothetical protein BVX98_00615 [bacterium F11]